MKIFQYRILLATATMLYMVTIVNHVLTWINPKSLQMVTAAHLVKAMVVPVICMDVRDGLQRKLSTKELMLLNCDVREDS